MGSDQKIKPKILLLHPPAPKGLKYQLDGYCSQPQKGVFRWHPVDLCCFASRLHPTCDLTILDLGRTCHLPSVSFKNFDAVIGLVGAFSWNSLKLFWKGIIDQGVPVFLSGDIARHDPEFVFLNLPGLKGILPEMAAPPSWEDLSSITSPLVWRPSQPEYSFPPVGQGFKIGIQPFSLWKKELYRLPFDVSHPFASIVTQVGCPHQCQYCILSSYSLAQRNYDEIEEELAHLKFLKIRHLYIRDGMLNTSDQHLEKICSLMRKYHFSWNAFAHLLNAGKHVPLFQKSGCRVLQFGFDSINREVLKTHRKAVPISWEEALKPFHKSGIKTVGHFIHGLEKEPLSPMELAEFAHGLKLDWMTTTPLMHRPGTAFWNSNKLEQIEPSAPEISGSIRNSMFWFYSRPSRIFHTLKCMIRHGFYGLLSITGIG